MRWRIVATAVTALALASVAIFVVSRDSAECSGPTAPSTDSANATFEAAADGFTLRITRDDAFYIGALDWFLRIGDVEFYRGDLPGPTLDTIIFDVPSEALQHLEDGDPISVNYGNPRAGPFAVNRDPPPLPGDPIGSYVAAPCD